jgi:uncharacterized membrane protein YjfL (UPF0719 family)
MNRKILNHIAIPTLLPIIFFIVAATPVELFGCRLRGLIAVTLALAGGLLGLATVSKGLLDMIRNRPGSVWWIATTLILSLPAFYIVLFET